MDAKHMDAAGKPLPEITDATRPFWTAAKNRKLVVQKCGRCGTLNFFPKPWCIDCGSRRLNWVEVSGQGTVYSFTTATSVDDNRSVHRDSSPPVYLRSDSLQPASSLPDRLQAAAATTNSSSSSANGTNGHHHHQHHPRHPSPLHDCTSAASPPCASVYAALSLDGERGIGEAGSAVTTLPRSQSPFRVSRRAIMNGDAELPHRSSSPLKRRASSMDPEPDASPRNGEDANMNSSQTTATAKSADAPRAMSVDPPEGADAPAQSKLPKKKKSTLWREPGNGAA